MDRRDSDENLVWDIGYALWRSPFRVKRDQSIEACHMVAREIVAHLKLSRWVFERRPPEKPHG